MIDSILEGFLEDWCKNENIDFNKLPSKIINLVISRAEDDILDYIRQSDNIRDCVEEWAWMEIEQNLGKHPEWIIKINKEGEK